MQKPKASQQTTYARPTIPGRAHIGQSPEVRSILNLHRSVGHQVVQRTVQNDADNPETGLVCKETSNPGHDVNEIPVRLHAADAIQTKMAISTPGDQQEQEADRVSEQVMRRQAVEPVIPHDAGLQRKESSECANAFAPPVVQDVLTSGGRPFDANTRAFMESRFNQDFGHVRIHDSDKGAESASSINALAYTLGNHIVFNKGQYAPYTRKGKKLLAHELAHVVQQGNGNGTDSIQRFSDTDHHIVEEVALGRLFSEDELKSIEQGNLQRDYSQLPAAANDLLLGTKDAFGGYKRHEHFDNFIFDRDKNHWVSHDEFDKVWDNNAKQWVKRMVPSLKKKSATPKMTPIQYIEGEFLAAVAKDMPDSASFVHLGNAFHTIEDFFAHSNFVELTKGDFSSGRELTTHPPGAPGPESTTDIFTNVFDVGSAAHFAEKFRKEREKASSVSHGRMAKDFRINPNQSMALTLAALVIKEVAVMIKAAFALKTKGQRRKYVNDVIMTSLTNYLRPPSDKDKWWEKLLAEDRGVTARRIKALQNATPVTVNQSPASPLRNFEATRFSAWKAIGLGTSVSLPLKNKSFFTAGYMLYLPGTGSNLDDRIFVAPRSEWEAPGKPSFILGAQISGSFDEINLFKKGR